MLVHLPVVVPVQLVAAALAHRQLPVVVVATVQVHWPAAGAVPALAAPVPEPVVSLQQPGPMHPHYFDFSHQALLQVLEFHYQLLVWPAAILPMPVPEADGLPAGCSPVIAAERQTFSAQPDLMLPELAWEHPPLLPQLGPEQYSRLSDFVVSLVPVVMAVALLAVALLAVALLAVALLGDCCWPRLWQAQLPWLYPGQDPADP